MGIKGLRILCWDDFSGGLNTKAGPGALVPNEYSSALNIYLWERGIAKRKGFARYNNSARIATSSPGMGLYDARFTTATQILGVAGTAIAKKGTNAWTAITGSVALTTGKPVLFTMQNNEVVGVNGTDTGWYYTGTGNATTIDFSNAPTTPTCAESFQGRLFMGQGRILYWSPYMGDWKNAWASDTNQAFPENIVGMKILGYSSQISSSPSILIIYCVHSVWACIFDPSIATQAGGAGTFRFDKISGEHGCASGYSIKECPLNDGSLVHIWADYDGLKAMNSNYQITKLTENIQPDWELQNFAQIGNAQGIYYKPRRWYMYSYADGTSSTHNRVLIFDTRFWKPISFFDWAISQMDTVNISGVEYPVGSDYSGYWNQYDINQNDNDAAINAYAVTRVQDDEATFTDKGFMSIGVNYANLGNFPINIQAYYDDSRIYGASVTYTPTGAALDSFVLDQDILAADAILTMARKEIYGRGRSIQLRISNATADTPFRIHKLFASYQQGKTMHL